ncbi:hypothetical protein [Sediminitomix flava]|nr:hypothetical protein [Sediminitomix flava]
MIGLISPIIVYYIIKQLKTITKDPTYGQNIIAPNDIENVYNTSSGVYVLGGGKVILNNEIAGDGKHKLGFLLNIHVENGLIQKVSPF